MQQGKIRASKMENLFADYSWDPQKKLLEFMKEFNKVAEYSINL